MKTLKYSRLSDMDSQTKEAGIICFINQKHIEQAKKTFLDL